MAGTRCCLTQMTMVDNGCNEFALAETLVYWGISASLEGSQGFLAGERVKLARYVIQQASCIEPTPACPHLSNHQGNTFSLPWICGKNRLIDMKIFTKPPRNWHVRGIQDVWEYTTHGKGMEMVMVLQIIVGRRIHHRWTCRC